MLETLHTIGLAILFYAVLPNLDTLRAGMVANGVLLFPSMLSILQFTSYSSSKTTKYILIALDGKILIENIQLLYQAWHLNGSCFRIEPQVS